eukprot:654150-Rhodomonas_salina.3
MSGRCSSRTISDSGNVCVASTTERNSTNSSTNVLSPSFASGLPQLSQSHNPSISASFRITCAIGSAEYCVRSTGTSRSRSSSSCSTHPQHPQLRVSSDLRLEAFTASKKDTDRSVADQVGLRGFRELCGLRVAGAGAVTVTGFAAGEGGEAAHALGEDAGHASALELELLGPGQQQVPVEHLAQRHLVRRVADLAQRLVPRDQLAFDDLGRLVRLPLLRHVGPREVDGDGERERDDGERDDGDDELGAQLRRALWRVLGALRADQPLRPRRDRGVRHDPRQAVQDAPQDRAEVQHVYLRPHPHTPPPQPHASARAGRVHGGQVRGVCVWREKRGEEGRG